MKKIAKTVTVEVDEEGEAEALRQLYKREYPNGGGAAIAPGTVVRVVNAGAGLLYTGYTGLAAIVNGPDTDGDYYILYFDDDGNTEESYVNVTGVTIY